MLDTISVPQCSAPIADTLIVRRVPATEVLVKEEKSVIIEAAVADLMQFAEQLIWENPEIQKKMQEMDLKPEDVKAGIQRKKKHIRGIYFQIKHHLPDDQGSRIRTPF